MAPPKIALFGWYMHGNFGDDVMAVIFAQTVRAAGCEPVVYKGPRYLAELDGIQRADSITSLLEGASACVLGGGGLFVSGEHSRSPSILAFDEEFGQLARICKAHSIPVWGASIGGTGIGRAGRLYPGLASLLCSGVVRGATLRLERDKPLLDAFDIPSEHFPDVVFLSSDFWPSGNARGRRDVVVTNNIGHRRAGRALIKFLDACGPTLLGATPKHVMTRHASVAFAGSPAANTRLVPYRDIQSFANLFSRARAVVTSKLHPGIFAMSYGAPFFSYGGKAKTKAQLAELGLENHILSTRDIPSWMLGLRNEDNIARLALSRVPELQAAARGHLTRLTSFLLSVTAREIADQRLPHSRVVPHTTV